MVQNGERLLLPQSYRRVTSCCELEFTRGHATASGQRRGRHRHVLPREFVPAERPAALRERDGTAGSTDGGHPIARGNCAAGGAARREFRSGFNYAKEGGLSTDLQPTSLHQGELDQFSGDDGLAPPAEDRTALMDAMDVLNRRSGRDFVRIGNATLVSHSSQVRTWATKPGSRSAGHRASPPDGKKVFQSTKPELP